VGLNGLLHVLILFTFLTALFYKIVAPLSKHAFEHEIEEQLGGLHAMAKDIPPELRVGFAKILGADAGGGQAVIDAAIERFSVPLAVIAERNWWVRLRALEFISALLVFVVVIFMVLAFSCRKCTGAGAIVRENLITFLFVGGVEYLFFTHIASKYVPAPPSMMATTLVETFRKAFV
jgi:hypothetical protein